MTVQRIAAVGLIQGNVRNGVFDLEGKCSQLRRRRHGHHSLPYGNGLIAAFFARVFARRYFRKRRPDGRAAVSFHKLHYHIVVYYVQRFVSGGKIRVVCDYWAYLAA
jgi:hypothetical protein